MKICIFNECGVSTDPEKFNLLQFVLMARISFRSSPLRCLMSFEDTQKKVFLINFNEVNFSIRSHLIEDFLVSSSLRSTRSENKEKRRKIKQKIDWENFFLKNSLWNDFKRSTGNFAQQLNK